MIKLKEIQQSISNYPGTSIGNTMASNTFLDCGDKPDFLNHSYIHQQEASQLRMKKARVGKPA
eukprot:CAMPEP_0202980216 /NCGR_PEP_ID=MMETSP1396-20130829/86180_1 /ASSEMBLY_ACC=CAM_ASM_000872 /TAXON_ID= /ORGANISM="Pseudokeronopsis sp., Strain Brazil" /LENGTH=62 /DNA_ID=CAMNT_0049720045 /DNA_START=413 /DNA_END=601 /DNA_ORIENTATION=-